MTAVLRGGERSRGMELERARTNKTYGGDAYTPTAPAVEYPVNYDRMRAMENQISELSK